eukprot:6374754-Pyramimonas_sp.AAC.1
MFYTKEVLTRRMYRFGPASPHQRVAVCLKLLRCLRAGTMSNVVRKCLAAYPTLEKFASPDGFTDRNGFHQHVAELHLEILQEDLQKTLEAHDGRPVSRNDPVIT